MTRICLWLLAGHLFVNDQMIMEMIELMNANESLQNEAANIKLIKGNAFNKLRSAQS